MAGLSAGEDQLHIRERVRQYPSDFVIRSVLVSGGTAKILMTGSERPPTIEDLGAKIQSEVEEVAHIDLRFVPSQDYRHP